MINTNFNIFSINTSLFLNCLEGVTEEQAIQSMSTNTNSLKWLAAHVTWARYQISALMGNPPANNPFDGLFENFRPYAESDDLKSLKEIKQPINTTRKKKEKGCTEPLYGEKSKCVLKIIPFDDKESTFQIDKKCIKKILE